MEPKKSFKIVAAVASAGNFISGKTKNADKIKISIWPEWTENEMNSEKWVSIVCMQAYVFEGTIDPRGIKKYPSMKL